jgi:hypothetical protein
MASGSASMNSSFDMITPSQRAQAEWEIANTGRITMYQFKVSKTRIKASIIADS